MLNTAKQVLDFYGLAGAQVEPYGTGLINDTYLVSTQGGDRLILQALNPIFEPEINLDIDRLTRHLEDAGVATKRLLATQDNRLWVNLGDRNWRLSTYVAGVCFDQVKTEAQAAAAGELLGRFHRGVKDLDIELHTQRLGVHDTERHLSSLRAALKQYSTHRYFAKVKVLAESVLDEVERLPKLPDLPDRLVHGDPKISNLVFSSETGAGVAMIDLDTLTHMPLPLEMGDAFRSWCNPRGEDHEQSSFSLELFAAAIGGYANVASDFILEAEWRSFVSGARIIMVELAARFTADALKESYFGWNPELFKDRSTHNQVRASGQLDLQRSLASQVDEAERIVEQAFAA